MVLADFYVFLAWLFSLVEPKTFVAVGGFAVTFFVVTVLFKIYSRRKYLRCQQCKHTIRAIENET